MTNYDQVPRSSRASGDKILGKITDSLIRNKIWAVLTFLIRGQLKIVYAPCSALLPKELLISITDSL